MSVPPPPGQAPYGAPHPGGAPYGAPAPGAPGAPQPGPVPVGGPAPVPPRPGSDLGADLGATFRWMWRAFTANLAAFLVPGIVYGLIITGLMVVMVIAFVAVIAGGTAAAQGSDGSQAGLAVLGGYLVMLPFVLVAIIVSILWSSGAGRAASIIREGGRPSIGQSFVGPGRVVLTIVLVQVLAILGTLACYLPGIVFSVLAMYAVPAALRGMSPGAALAESFRTVRAQLGTSIVVLLLLGICASLASYLVVTVVVVPGLTMLASVALYERVSGRELPEPALG